MPTKTHSELVLEEILRQWPERVAARAKLMGRPLGHDDVSDKRARELWNQQNPNLEMVYREWAAHPEYTEWQRTAILYPNRKMLLDAVKNEGGVKAMIRFSDRMNATPKAESGEREEVSRYD